MPQNPIGLSPDLRRLVEEGYEIQIRGNFLLIGHIPYVNAVREIKYGVLTTELTHTNGVAQTPADHVIGFRGEYPCHKDGSKILALQYMSQEESILTGFSIQHRFSNKPGMPFPNYYDKVRSYADIISAPAISMDDSVIVRTFRVLPDENEENVFLYPDTNSSRANINPVSDKLKGQRIAIIGVGGTGSYILDFIAKTPVAEIHLFDAGIFGQHNAFRAPGAASHGDLDDHLKKVNYYARIYSKMRTGIIPHDYKMLPGLYHELTGFTYVFITIDKGGSKPQLFEFLASNHIPFIDAGMGITRVGDSLIGMLRVTTGTPEKHDHLLNRISVDDDDELVYQSNAQLVELNAMNAAMAIIKWKKMSGFYVDQETEHHSQYTLEVSQLLNADNTNPLC